MQTIAVLPGDGIGEEVIREGLRVLETVSAVTGLKYKLEHYPYGAEHYLKTQEAFPDSALRAMKDHDAILLGAIGDPRIETGYLEREIIMGLRFGLDLYINLRPIKLYAEHLCPLKGITPNEVDFLVVRENTEGAYLGLGGIMKKGTPDEVAVCDMLWTRKGVDRVVQYGYHLATKRNKKKRLTLIDKANAIRAQDLWTRTFAEIGAEYPEIEQDHAYVDAAQMWMIKNPAWFDVIVTTNLFGDIVSDLGAMLQGGMGAASSGNIHPGRVSMFEPIHGSAPKYKGQNKVCPVATILAVQMMLEHLGDSDGAQLIENAVGTALRTKTIPSLKAGSIPTDKAGDAVLAEIKAQTSSSG